MRLLLGCKAATYKNGETLADVLTWNHYGTETIPPRPVLRIAAERILEDQRKYIQAAIGNMIVYSYKGLTCDAEDVEKKLLTQLGRMTIAEARRIIDAGDQLQHNAPATVAKKGFDQPLYETGLMQKNLACDIED